MLSHRSIVGFAVLPSLLHENFPMLSRAVTGYGTQPTAQTEALAWLENEGKSL